MNDLIPRLDISRLIVKDLNGEIKESEKQELKEWINESEENKALYLRAIGGDPEIEQTSSLARSRT